VPTLSDSDFDGLSRRSLNNNYRATEAAQSFKFDTVLDWPSRLTQSVISSAKDVYFTPNELISLSIGETYADNNNGPSTEP
jgi:hypothetical protein